MGPDTGLSSSVPECPLGYTCTCVGSCPACDDCAAQVCVRGAFPIECKTACDCEPGLGCFDGRCIAGFAPVYCCEGDVCPAGEQCQHLDGRQDRCEDRLDPTCRERVEKITKVIAKLVARSSACREDKDCVQISTSTQCVGTCGDFVNRRYASRIQRAIRRYDRKICSTYQQEGCPFAIPGCLATKPACVENRCSGVPILPEPGPRPLPLAEIFPSAGGNLNVEAAP